MNIFFYLRDPWLTPLGTPWAPLGTYRVPLGDAHLGTLEANFFVSWAILKRGTERLLSFSFKLIQKHIF